MTDADLEKRLALIELAIDNLYRMIVVIKAHLKLDEAKPEPGERDFIGG